MPLVLLPLLLFPLEDGRAPLGLNLSGVTDWSSELVFVDAFRAARPWISQSNGKPWGQGGPLDVDEKGHVRSLRDGQFAETVVFTDFSEGFPSGMYTCLYAGKGELDFAMDARVVSREPGRLRVEVKPNARMATCRILKTDPSDPIRSIRLIHPGHEQSYEQEPFLPEFLERWRGVRVFRFMDWQSTNNSPIKEWTQRPTLDQHSQAMNGVALELMIELCNKTKVNPWFCMPHQASDDFVRRFAGLVQRKLDPSLRVFVEYSNECWNGQFKQAGYCRERGKNLDLSKNDYEAQLRYYSQRSVEMFTIWEEVFGGRDRLVRVLAAQSANPWTGSAILDWRQAGKKADAIAIAPYFGHRWGDPKKADQNVALTADQLVDQLQEDLRESHKHVAAYAELARKHGIKLMAYEGGQHLAGYGGAENNERLTQLLQAVNRHPRMKHYYSQDLQHWNEVGGDVFCVFSSMGRFSKWGSWGLLEHRKQPLKEAPKLQAIRTYLRMQDNRH